MKPIHLISAIVFPGCCLLLGSCASPQASAPVASTQTTADWKAGEYTVSFRAGPVVDFGSKSFSSYEISRKPTPTVIAAESAFSIEWFRGSYAIKPGDYIKLLTTTSGKTLLIEERIPNDNSPCTNWILVRIVNGEPVHDYLDLPIRAGGPDPLVGELPTVSRISEHEVSFRYPNGKSRTMAVKDVIKKEKRPTFPG